MLLQCKFDITVKKNSFTEVENYLNPAYMSCTYDVVCLRRNMYMCTPLTN